MTMQRRARAMFLVLVVLAASVAGGRQAWAQTTELQLRFDTAEQTFASVQQPDSIALFDALIDDLRALRAGTADVTDMLVRSLSYRAQAAYNVGDVARAEADLRDLIRLDPVADIDRDRASPKFAEVFDGLRGELVGSLVVNVGPPDATLRINGGVVDWHSGFVPLLAGEYVVNVDRLGYNAFQQEIVVEAGVELPIDVALDRVAAVLTVTLDPADAALSVDGGPVQAMVGSPAGDPDAVGAGVFSFAVMPGSHTLDVALDGYRARSEAFEISGLSDYRIDAIVLEATRGAVALHGVPTDAVVLIDGVTTTAQRSETTALLEMPPGSYRIEVDGGAAGFYAHDIVVADRDELSLEVRLAPTITFLGVLGGDTLGRDRFQAATSAAMSGHAQWMWLDRATEASAILENHRVDAAMLRGLSRPEALIADALGAPMAAALPSSAYVLGVLDDDLVATRVDLWIWPGPPGPPAAQVAALEIDAADLEERVREMFSIEIGAARPWFGALVVDSAAAATPTIFDVASGGPAEQAGLVVGDELITLGGTAVDSSAAVAQIIRESSQATLPVRVRRGAAELDVSVTLATDFDVVTPGDAGAAYGLLWAAAEAQRSDPASDVPAWVLDLNQAAVLLNAARWEDAVRLLRATEAPRQAGIGAGTVDFWTGQALLELGDAYYPRAREALERALEVPGATIGHRDGPRIAPLARALLAFLGS